MIQLRLNRVALIGLTLVLATAGCSESDSGGEDATVVDAGSGADAAEDSNLGGSADVTLPDVTQQVNNQGLFQEISVPGNTNQVFHGCWTDGSTRAYLAGTGGTIIGWDGLSWQQLTSGVFTSLNGVAGGKGGLRAHAAGLAGTVVSGVAANKTGVATVWGPPGGCKSAADCNDNNACSSDYCESGICQHAPSGAPGCCGSVAMSDNFTNLANWTVTDLYEKVADKGGIVWSAAAMTGKDGTVRTTSAPKAMYFGRLNVPCPKDKSKVCATFDNGKVVGATARSQLFQLPVSESVKLSFQLLLDVENGTGFDVLTLHVKQGSKKTLVWDKNKLGGAGSTEGKFVTQVVDLTNWSGVSIQLEFTFDAKQKDINDGEGVFIDDLLVQTTCKSGSTATKGLTKATFFDIWASGDALAFAVGVGGAIARWDGTAWSMQTGGKIKEILGLGGTAGVLQLAVGQGGMLGTLGPNGIDPIGAGTNKDLYDLAVTADDATKIHAVAVGAQGTVLEFDKGKWATKAFPYKGTLRAVTAAGGGVYYVVANNQIYQRNTNGTYTFKGSAPAMLYDVATVGPGTAMAVGSTGLLMELKGGVWTPKTGTFGLNDAYSIHVNSPKDIWVVGNAGMIAHWTGGPLWTGMKSPSSKHLRSVWASAPDNVWAVGLAGTILRYDGTKWANVKGPSDEIDWLKVWGSDPNDIYAAGKGGILARWDGVQWRIIAAPVTQTLRAVWGLGPKDVWAVGDKGAIYHNTGGGWTPTPIDPYEVPDQDPYIVESTLYAVWGASSNDVWAAGAPDSHGKGVLVHWDGKSWKYNTAMKDESRVIRTIWGWNKNRIIFAGTQGMALLFDGKAFGELETGSIATFFDVCSWGKDALFVGSVGTVLRYIPPLLPTTGGEDANP
ncbi:MAG: hypothetical protein KC502_00465 [Myxococcales bacterium]|nr:hypothetical protein [Myxococcales bacterium]